ncbi:His-Xaa-Ser system radical SAM maturase HxsC [Serratia rubidaea]|uniref:His-Xaa-Ser system radical SAM maturase HxsC n=1 Tax=Serratia rubidaea TaxID=61652 RepID=UPI0023B1AFBF|nr:His-Xaa-Ser system radical SAM maturase HxsC [Serratia rubidaea]MDK1703111.1 His-Xaa-Ser system radical SAM maturase HxsC [Serratia rubidaea]
MSDVIRNDVFHYVSSKDVPMGFYRLCKSKPVDPKFFLPNLQVLLEPNSESLKPYFSSSVVSESLYKSIDDGDIGVISSGNMLRVILSRRANHNTVLVTERCNNNCLFCSQPPKFADDSGLLIQSALAIAAFDFDGLIGVSGGEPLVYGDDFLDFLHFIVENSPKTSLHVLTNGRQFSDLAYARKVKRISDDLNITFGIPLYSSTATIHDKLVGSSGAYSETVRGLINAGNLGINIELRIIPTKQNVAELPNLVEYVNRVFSNVTQISVMGLEPIGWARKNWDEISIDNHMLMDSFRRLKDIVNRVNIPLVLFNYTKCQLPKYLWEFSVQSISDWKNYYPIECEKCSVKSSCAGYFSSSKGRFHQAPRPII